ncbi:MAG: aldehyde-activating protein [Alphaproteobacteria bacterium]|nr:aldehyde-activating protein [Alphaproteobacteria bacterium]
MDDWKLPWEGGCRCGAVRIRVTAPPLLASACHCTGCRKMTGSAFSLALSVPAEGFEMIQGETVTGGLRGPVAHHHHCDNCKSWIFTRVDGLDFFVNLRATMLDDDRWFAPFVEFFTGEKLPWAATGAAHSYATQPGMEEYQALIADYQARGARP